MSHIAIYLPSLQGGGAERVMVTVANGLAALGHRIDLVLTNAEGPYLGRGIPSGATYKSEQIQSLNQPYAAGALAAAGKARGDAFGAEPCQSDGDHGQDPCRV